MSVLFEDIFDVKTLNPDGKKFDRGAWRPGGRLRAPPLSARALTVPLPADHLLAPRLAMLLLAPHRPPPPPPAVTRCVCKGVSYEMDMVLDVNTEVYPVREGDRYSCAIASTLSLDGKPDSGEYDPSGQPSLLDRFEYAMYGRFFKFEQTGDDRCTVFISFGGLLMALTGDQRHLVNLKPDSKLYLLMRKTE